MPQDLFKRWLNCIREVRGGGDDKPLAVGDIYMCFNGTKDRKRHFTKPLQVPLTGKDPNRTQLQVVLVHMTEASWRSRRAKHTGRSRLTQQLYIAANARTLKSTPKRKFATHVGSTNADVVGPVVLDSMSSLPTLSRDDKI